MRICLVRHGETDWNNIGKLQGREDVPMNTTGINQVKETAKYLKNFAWKAIISSPLSRARMSAEIIAAEIGTIEIYEEGDFIERDYGAASGMTAEERKANFPDGNWTGVEPAEALQQRTLAALSRSIEKFEGGDIIIVSHGSAINSILAYYSNNEIGTGRTALKNAGMVLLEKDEGEIKIVSYDKIAYEF